LSSGAHLLIIWLGHEFQVLAPAYWTATLHHGGVLRVKTRLVAQCNWQAWVDESIGATLLSRTP